MLFSSTSRVLRGGALLVADFIIYIASCCIILIAYGLIALIPIKKYRQALRNKATHLFGYTWQCFRLAAALLGVSKIEIVGKTPIDRKGWYLIIANHHVGLDILMIGAAMTSKSAPIKFFLKKQLLWSLPLAGLTAYVAGWPFLDRKSTTNNTQSTKGSSRLKDIDTARQACHQLLNSPTNLILFPEGTRFTEEKKQSQKSPYQHLLKPKSIGIATIINEMSDKLSGVIDLTISYAPNHCSLKNFFTGKVTKVCIDYDVIPLTPDLLGDFESDRAYRKHLQAWLNNRWALKDQILQGKHE